MKFRFCSEGDCPQWALAALHAASTLPSATFRALLETVTAGNQEDNIREILKDTSLENPSASRDESARAAAVLRWTLRQAWSSGCTGAQLTRDLLVLGVPRAHAALLADAADEGRERYEAESLERFVINRVSDASAAAGPEGSIDTIKLSLQTDDVFTGEQADHELLVDKAQATLLLNELKKAYAKMEGIDKTNT